MISEKTRKDLRLNINHPYAQFQILPFLDDFVMLSKISLKSLRRDNAITREEYCHYNNMINDVIGRNYAKSAELVDFFKKKLEE